MNKKLEILLERVSEWPEEAQAELMQSIVEIEAKHVGIYRLSDDERAAVKRGLQEMREGNFATDEQVAAVFDRYRS
jgi:predicted transcriptional regulator